MKLRLAVLDDDKSYLSHFVDAIGAKYPDKFEIYSFSGMDKAMQTVEEKKIDVLLASDSFEIDTEALPNRCGLAYLVESKDIETFKEVRAICKFQKMELIYKQILDVFAEKSAFIKNAASSDGSTKKTVAFLAASGGTGSTVAAAAYATHMARLGKKVVYLNMEMLGDPDVFFHGEGSGNFGDVLYAVKSRKSNLAVKLESTVKKDPSGVYYFSATTLALDMMDLKTEEMVAVIKELTSVCDYDVVVIDIDFKFDKQIMELLKICSNMILVSDGSAASNGKILRMLESLNVIEQNADDKLTYRMGILYNRFSSKTSSVLEEPGVPVLGGIKRYEGYTMEQLITEISQLNVFDTIE